MITPCHDGYTIYLADRLDETSRIKAYKHAMKHINNNDFENLYTAQELEHLRHMENNDVWQKEI